MNHVSCNGSPQQIPLQQLPFANEAKPHYHFAEHSGLRWSQVYQKYIYLYFSKFDLINFDKVELDCEIDGF